MSQWDVVVQPLIKEKVLHVSEDEIRKLFELIDFFDYKVFDADDYLVTAEQFIKSIENASNKS